MAAHFVFVEAFKHATADQTALTRLSEWKAIERTCPQWLHEQLRRLRPRRIILCGNPGKNTVAPLLLSERDAQEVRHTTVDAIHGAERDGRIDDIDVPDFSPTPFPDKPSDDGGRTRAPGQCKTSSIATRPTRRRLPG